MKVVIAVERLTRRLANYCRCTKGTSTPDLLPTEAAQRSIHEMAADSDVLTAMLLRYWACLIPVLTASFLI